ncbi:DUF4328 domain-containing protein [Taibaiella helva]|uniref:DUF4328 domain-containing protein n=1 Tax=Taibaiella helva TaxID=2301235 RepID=UPI000E58DDEC|nr:DUF4328 domain-containing protein [Taibaiella helva]
MDIPNNLFPSGLEALLVFLAVLILLVISFVLYLITLQNTLKAIQSENQRMPPGQVWLLFIPLFNLVWQFIVVSRVASSIQAEQRARGVEYPDPSVNNIGLTYCILNCLGIIPFVGALARLAAMVCWIIHWVKVNAYRKQFLAEPFIPRADDSEIFGYGKL